MRPDRCFATRSVGTSPTAVHPYFYLFEGFAEDEMLSRYRGMKLGGLAGSRWTGAFQALSDNFQNVIPYHHSAVPLRRIIKGAPANAIISFPLRITSVEHLLTSETARSLHIFLFVYIIESFCTIIIRFNAAVKYPIGKFMRVTLFRAEFCYYTVLNSF